MLRLAPCLGSGKKQKRARKAARNRYCAGAKLSEHKFLRLLRGYADGIPAPALEPTTHVGGKTIRATYRTFRTHLPMAAQRDTSRFAGAGLHLFEGGDVSAPGREFLRRIEQSKRFSRYVKRHAPRFRSEEELHLLRIEKAVRVFCALDLRGIDGDDHLLDRIGEAFTQLRPNEPLHNLALYIPGARPYAHHVLRLYEDYRRYLLKNPL